jgi:hypothetical protein
VARLAGVQQIKEMIWPVGSSFECIKQIFGVPFKELLFLFSASGLSDKVPPAENG